MSKDKKINKVKVIIEEEENPDLLYLQESEYPEDRKLVETYGREWILVGVRAEAEILTKEKGYIPESWLINYIRSGGLWGIDSTCSLADIKEIVNGQINDLIEVLKILGFTSQGVRKPKVEYDDKTSIWF